MVSSKDDNNEKREMHEKHDNIKIMMNYEADEVIEELFQSLKKRYQSYKNKQKEQPGPILLFSPNYSSRYLKFYQDIHLIELF